LEQGEIMELEEIRTLTIKALEDFNRYSDDTNMGPEMKQIDQVKKRVEELMFLRDPKSSRADTRFSNVTPSVRMNKIEGKYFLESFQDLIRQGVLIWGKDAGDFQTGFYPWFSVTTYGKKVLASGEITPHDSFGYIERLTSTVTDLDELVLQYVRESLDCYSNGNLMASAVMLGVASEAAFYHLLDAFKKSVHVDVRAKEKAERLELRINITDKFNVVYEEIKNRKGDLANDLGEVIDYNLNGIFNLIRLQRNESGHPTGVRPDRDQMFANLTIFIMYCKTLYRLIRWLGST